MFHQGFYALFFIISFSFGMIVMLFSLFATKILFKKPKKKLFTLKDFNALIPEVTTQQRALELVDLFFSKFRTIQQNSKQKTEWLETLKNLVGLEYIDTDKAADIREKLSKFNPSLEKEISDQVGIALKTKQQ